MTIPRAPFIAASAIALCLTLSGCAGSSSANKTHAPVSSAGQEPSSAVAVTSAPVTTAPPAPEPRFAGRYSVVIKTLRTTGLAETKVGEVKRRTWTVTAACATGSCGASVKSSSGSKFAFDWNPDSQTWSLTDGTSQLTCGNSSAKRIPETDVEVLRPPATATGVLRTLTGTQVAKSKGLCPGHTVVVTADFSLTLTRIGS